MQVIKPAFRKPLEDNGEMNHSQHRFVRNKLISCFDRAIGFVDKGEGWALMELWV